MQRKIITTADGSKTIQIEEWNEQYHSIHGALQEARYVFIKQGLQHYRTFLDQDFKDKHHKVSILEIGFGTGLNAFLTLTEAEDLNLNINYIGVEAYPVENTEISQLDYAQLVDSKHRMYFQELHQVSWGSLHEITTSFSLEKRQQYFDEISDENAFDLIYFDAFGERVQPELWKEEIFVKMYKALRPSGVLVTYAAIGEVRRAMTRLGFTVERLPGPPGKRHMLRATKKPH